MHIMCLKKIILLKKSRFYDKNYSQKESLKRYFFILKISFLYKKEFQGNSSFLTFSIAPSTHFNSASK